MVLVNFFLKIAEKLLTESICGHLGTSEVIKHRKNHRNRFDYELAELSMNMDTNNNIIIVMMIIILNIKEKVDKNLNIDISLDGAEKKNRPIVR